MFFLMSAETPGLTLETPAEEPVGSSFFMPDAQLEVLSFKDNLPMTARRIGDLVAKYGYEEVFVQVWSDETVAIHYPGSLD